MSDEIKTETIEVPETEIVEAVAPQKPSRDELKANGWSKTELDSAEKHGMIKKKEEAEVKPNAKAEPETKEAAKPEAAEEPKKEEAVAIERRLNGALPDFKLNPDQEKVFLDSFGPGTQPRAMYFRMKNERQQRQAAETRARELEAKIQELQSKPTKDTAVDENGNEIDPEDKPLTVKEWKALQAEEAEQRQKQQDEIRQKGNVVAESLKTQEEYAKSIFTDYDSTVNLAKELISNLETYLPNKWEQERAIELIQALQVRAANADKFGLDDRNAAMISYEIGKLHPNYGKSSNHGDTAESHNDGNSDRPDTKANGSLTPGKKMERIENNTQRRVSSASIPGGGGKRSISVDDVTLVDLNKMDYQERQKFKTKYPDRYASLLRG